jgi:ankyrin repeat protein
MVKKCLFMGCVLLCSVIHGKVKDAVPPKTVSSSVVSPKSAASQRVSSSGTVSQGAIGQVGVAKNVDDRSSVLAFDKLEILAKDKKFEEIKQILLAHPQAKSAGGSNSLIIAINLITDDTILKDTVKQLIAKGADINAKDNYERTVLENALIYLNDKQSDILAVIIQMLIDAGVGVNAKSGEMQPLFLTFLIENGVILQQVFQKLLDKGADVNAKDFNGDNALISAINSYSRNPGLDLKNIVSQLLARGVDINATGSIGWNSLIRALYRIKKYEILNDIVKLLIVKGIEVPANALLIFLDNTRLDLTKIDNEEAFLEIVRQLLAKNVQINSLPPYLLEPLFFAIMMMRFSSSLSEKLVTLLLEKGADSNMIGAGGITPLMALFWKSHNISDSKKIASLLIAKGADMYAKDKQGMTVFDYIDKLDTRDINVSQKNELKKILQETYEKFGGKKIKK